MNNAFTRWVELRTSRHVAILALLVLATTAALTGCATTPPKQPEPIVQTVYCVTPDQLQEIINSKPAKVGGTLTGDAQSDILIEGKQVVLLNTYADGLISVLTGCTGPAPSDV